VVKLYYIGTRGIFMNKNIKRIIALTLTINTFSVISAITPGRSFDIAAKPAYASSYSPSADELKTLKVKSTNGDTLDLRDGYNGDTVKLNDDKEYYVKLTDDSEGIKINAEAEGEDEIVRIFTSDKEDATGYQSGDEILLGKGDTTIYVRTYASLSDYRKAKDQENDVTDCEEEYTINVRKTQESDYEDDTQDAIYLDNIELSKGNISFLKQRTSYDVKVDSSVSEIKITATPEDEDDRVRIDGLLVDSDDDYKKTVSLDDGENEIKVKVTDDKDNQRTYTLNITRGDASDSQDDVYLDDLKISDGDIDFSKDDTSYDVDVDDSVSKLTITAEPEDEDYAVTIDGDEVNSDDDYEKEVSLSKGENTIKVVVEDELNDKKRTYTLTVNRGQAEDEDNTSTDTTSDKKSQWVQSDKGWQYYDENGKILKSSWLVDKDTKVSYYLNADGYRATGWVNDNNNWFLLDKEGAMLKGWQYTDGKWYMLDKTNGVMKTGWYKENTEQSNNNTSASNDAVNSGNTNSNDNITKTEKWYYLSSDGSLKTGWLQDNGKWYYFNTSGVMQKGWLVYSNSKYYLNDDGTMATGTKTIDGKTYNFTDNGALII
jgi:glucan-binding YG repeat protein